MPAFSFEKLPPPEFRESLPAGPARFSFQAQSKIAETPSDTSEPAATSRSAPPPSTQSGPPPSNVLAGTTKPYRGLVVQMLDRLTRNPR